MQLFFSGVFKSAKQHGAQKSNLRSKIVLFVVVPEKPFHPIQYTPTVGHFTMCSSGLNLLKLNKFDTVFLMLRKKISHSSRGSLVCPAGGRPLQVFHP